MTDAPAPFGYCDILDDGRRVVAYYNDPRIWFEGRHADVPEWLMFLRAVRGPDGAAYAVGQGNRTGACWLVDETGRCKNLGLTAGTTPVAICVSAGLLLVAFQSGPELVTRLWIDPVALVTTASNTLPIPLTSQGLLGVHPDGTVDLTDPVDRYLGPVHVRFPCTVGAVSVAQGQLDPSQIVIVKGGVQGTLALTPCFEPHQSPNGQYWICRGTSAVVSGTVPADVPPLVTAPPPIAVPPDPDPEFPRFAVPVYAGPMFPTANGPGTIVIVPRGDCRLLAPKGALVALGLDALQTYIPPDLFGVYADTFDEAAFVIETARRLDVRALCNNDGGRLFSVAVLAAMQPWDLPILELFQNEGESLAIATLRWAAVQQDLRLHWPYQSGRILQAYLMNGVYHAGQVRAIAAAGVRSVKTPDVVAALAFALDRKDGVPAIVDDICRAAGDARPTLLPKELPMTVGDKIGYRAMGSSARLTTGVIRQHGDKRPDGSYYSAIQKDSVQPGTGTGDGHFFRANATTGQEEGEANNPGYNERVAFVLGNGANIMLAEPSNNGQPGATLPYEIYKL